MSVKQWFALLCFYFAYLWAGGSLLYHFEHQIDEDLRRQNLYERSQLSEILSKCLEKGETKRRQEILDDFQDYCGKPLTNYTAEDLRLPTPWTYYHAIQFAFIACTTIGYGNISPRTTFGRIFLIFYTLIGIPLNAIVFAVLGEYFSLAFTGAYKRYKEYKRSHDKNYAPRRLGLIAQYILYLIPGMVLLIFLPAVWFSLYEDWPYSVSVYYAYVTLTTIGFGDFVASFQPEQPEKFGIGFVFYEVFMIIWIIFGLGYLVMIVSFLIKGMQSKRIKLMEHQLSENLKATQHRIWSGVSKDIGYLRQFISEMYIMRFKPVYNEPEDKINICNGIKRSASCPDLPKYRTELPPSLSRKRANSEHHIKPLDSNERISENLNRVQSDTDLSRINREKTFEQNSAMLKNGELLARVVNALGNMRPIDEDGQSIHEFTMNGGIHGFSDSQILTSERSISRWSLAPSDNSFAHPPHITRSRAASDFMSVPTNLKMSAVNERTWSGDNTPSIQLSRDSSKRKDNMFRNAFPLRNKIDSNRSMILGQDQPPEPLPRAINYSVINKLNQFRKRLYSGSSRTNSIATNDIESEQSNRRRGSSISLARQYLESTDAGRQSLFSVISNSDEPNKAVLEQTTIADLIRALEMVHTQANLSTQVNLLKRAYINCDAPPRRKLGTASLTPPKISPLMTLFAPKDSEHLNRRGSLRPISGYTTIYSSHTMHNTDNVKPPPYTEYVAPSPRPTIRKFSVRPTNLSIPPGQAPSINQNPSIQASSSLQRKLSLRPIPLARSGSQSSGRFARQTIQTSKMSSIPHATSVRNTALLKPALLQAASRSRHGSLSDLNKKLERKRTESK